MHQGPYGRPGEGEPAGRLGGHQQPLAVEFVDPAQDVRQRKPRGVGDRAGCEGVADHGRRARGAPGQRGQRVQVDAGRRSQQRRYAGGQFQLAVRPARRPRAVALGLCQRPQQARYARPVAQHQIAAQRAQRGRQQSARGPLAQRAQRNPHQRGRPVGQPGQALRGRAAAVRRDRQHRSLGRVVDEVFQQVADVLSGPVRVVEDEQHPGALGEQPQQGPYRAEHLVLLRPSGPAEGGEHLGQVVHVLRSEPAEEVSVRRGQMIVQSVHEDVERAAPAAARGPPAGHRPPLAQRLRGQSAQQMALADPGLPAERDEPGGGTAEPALLAQQRPLAGVRSRCGSRPARVLKRPVRHGALLHQWNCPTASLITRHAPSSPCCPEPAWQEVQATAGEVRFLSGNSRTGYGHSKVAARYTQSARNHLCVPERRPRTT